MANTSAVFGHSGGFSYGFNWGATALFPLNSIAATNNDSKSFTLIAQALGHAATMTVPPGGTQSVNVSAWSARIQNETGTIASQLSVEIRQL